MDNNGMDNNGMDNNGMDNNIFTKNNNSNNDSKKIVTMIVLIATLMICTTSATYAYFALSATNTSTVTGTAATHSLTLTVTQATMKTNTGVMVPQLASAIGSAMNSTNQCVDGNGNVVCKVYTITIKNTSTAKVVVNGTIQFTNPTSNLKWKRVSAAQSAGTNTSGSYTMLSATATRTDLTSGAACTPSAASAGCTAVSLDKTSGSVTYYIVVWINETGSSQGDSGTWTATVTFEGQNGKGVTSTITS